jgi:hypothetical protein
MHNPSNRYAYLRSFESASRRNRIGNIFLEKKIGIQEL